MKTISEKKTVTSNFYYPRTSYDGYRIVPIGTKKRGNRICKTFDVLKKHIPSIEYMTWEKLCDISFGSSLTRFVKKYELKNPKYDLDKLPRYMLSSLIRDFSVPKITAQSIFRDLKEK